MILHLAGIKYGVGGLKHLGMRYKSDLSTRGSKFPPLDAPLNVVNVERAFCVLQNQNTELLTSLPHNINVNDKFHVKPTLVHCK